MPRPPLLAATLAALLTAMPAQAQMGPPNPDLNRDGRVTLAEYRTSQADSLIGRFDKDGDRRVTKAEFQPLADMARRFGGARGVKFAARIWSMSDGNGDGTITQPELDASSTRRFQAADGDDDGVLSKAERKAMQAQASRAD